ncbi:MAG: hypothetical protein A3I39_01760 [Candidatus Yanofskybacteria bacterium RIFCSPLOWO2_02_FULL_47_9b]|uniref:Mur ligase central domain-containing protein n=1 Tax=Candidatus Yanofskybacteria bacterium RIFCSPLOWO2_02_FULL_47_9b TaxID=1802708 RepID=A0A1F8H918_9BACT|nr:MAG: hypothetical protein A3I39_01760 [Candidatus Yanofskybacteria bacterium RIFCSPLOWO2_02_FULL_47_9b]
MEQILSFFRRLVPAPIFNFFQPLYHYKLALLGALFYRLPSRQVKVLAVTGTKGKTTVCELLNFVLNETGHKSVVSSTLRSERSTPGRFALQKFLRDAVKQKCEYAVVEMTSQAVLQYRHKFIKLEALIYTGIHPEHIEAHGSFQNYLNAKIEIAKTRPRIIVANMEDEHGQKFLQYAREQKVSYKFADWAGYETNLLGDFNKLNVLAVAKLCLALGLPEAKVREAISKFEGVPGRVEFVPNYLGIDVVVDYAHTPGSLQAIYEAMSQNSKSEARNSKLICVLGACGGGRDKWKRPEFGKLANQYCAKIILTDEDPYDEDPKVIVDEIATGITDKSKLEIELDRRKAISRALHLAVVPPFGGGTASPVVLITGKGTDNYIHGPRGHNLPWSDKRVAEEELAKVR